MITAKLFRDKGILNIIPEGRLQPSDFEQVRLLVDPYIEDNGKLNGLLIDAESFPGWDNFSAMLSHFHFVQEHEKKIKRVAIVTDSVVFTSLIKFGKHFITAEVQQFNYRDRDNAWDWLSQC